MQAAAHGDSTLGIPKSVGQEYVKADSKAGKKRVLTHTGVRPGPKKTALG